MAYCVCQQCRRYLWWSAGRGRRLADYVCPADGGALRRERSQAELLNAHYRRERRLGYAVTTAAYNARYQTDTPAALLEAGDLFMPALPAAD